MVVPWLGLSAPSKGGLGSTPGRDTRSYMLKLSPAQTNINKSSSWHFPAATILAGLALFTCLLLFLSFALLRFGQWQRNRAYIKYIKKKKKQKPLPQLCCPLHLQPERCSTQNQTPWRSCPAPLSPPRHSQYSAFSLCGTVLLSATGVERSRNQTACLQVKGESSQHFRSWVPDGKVQRKLPVTLPGYKHHVVRPRAGSSLERKRAQDPQSLVCPHRWGGGGLACMQSRAVVTSSRWGDSYPLSVWRTLCYD